MGKRGKSDPETPWLPPIIPLEDRAGRHTAQSSPKPPRFSEEEIYRAISAAKRAGLRLTIDITEQSVRITIGESETPKPAPDNPRLNREVWKIEDVAEHWNISEGAVRRMVDAGKITHFRVGKLIRFKREVIEQIDRAGGVERPQTDWTEEVERFVAPVRPKHRPGR